MHGLITQNKPCIAGTKYSIKLNFVWSWIKIRFFFAAPQQQAKKLQMSVAGGQHRDLLRGSVKLLSWIVEKGILPAAVVFAAFVSGKKPAVK